MTPLLLALFVSAAPATSQERSETRFHRVHLRNGNFIDGDLAHENEKAITLRLRVGEMIIRRDQIRQIELVRIQERRAAPPPVAPDLKPAPARRDPFTPPSTRPAAPAPQPILLPGGTLQQQADHLLSQLAKARPDAKYGWVEKLVGLGRPVGPYLASVLAKADPQCRDFLGEAIRQLKSKDSIPPLRPLLASPDPTLRTSAASIYGEVGGEEAAADLHALLSDPDAIVRGTALGALERIGSRDSFKAVARLATDRDAEVRKRAIRALSALASRHDLKADLPDVLTAALDRAQGDARCEVLEALGKSGEKGTWTSAARHLEDPSPAVRAAAASALAALAAPESAEAILGRLPLEREMQPRAGLLAAAEALKLKAAVEPLLAWLRETDPSVRALAVRSLRNITEENFGLDYDKWAAWWETAKPK